MTTTYVPLTLAPTDLALAPFAARLRVSRNASIATSRTRAIDRPAIAYRPLPAAWGDVEELRRVRAARRAAEAW